MKSPILAFAFVAAWHAHSHAENAPSTETVAGDRKWILDQVNGPCSKLRDRYTDPPSIVAACHAQNASQPPCLIYKGFAKIWFDLRMARDPVLAYQPQVISRLGQGNDELRIDKSPEFRARLQRLLSATLSLNQTKWQSGDKWGEMAYSRCMAGQFL